MITFEYQQKIYNVDSRGYLLEFDHWDRNFAEGMAPHVKIHNGLTHNHWRIINYIRNTFSEVGICPLVYETCQANIILLHELKDLFPTGYLRGACKLAGLTYSQSFCPFSLTLATGDDSMSLFFQVDAFGFLIDPSKWNRQFSMYKAREMKMGELSEDHWRVINFLRNSYKQKGTVPTVYETCELNNLEIEDLEKLFPDGYHRGAIKIAGLKVL